MRIYTTVEQVKQLGCLHQQVIPEAYRDAMGHMNVRHYMGVFDDAGWEFFKQLGMDSAYYEQEESGGFELRSFITYVSEVHIGEEVGVYLRLIGCSETRIHVLYYLVNESTNVIAAAMETVSAHADLRQRKISPFPAHIRERILGLLDRHSHLDWEAPLCGVLGV